VVCCFACRLHRSPCARAPAVAARQSDTVVVRIGPEPSLAPSAAPLANLHPYDEQRRADTSAMVQEVRRHGVGRMPLFRLVLRRCVVALARRTQLPVYAGGGQISESRKWGRGIHRVGQRRATSSTSPAQIMGLIQQPWVDPNERSEDGYSPLHIARTEASCAALLGNPRVHVNARDAHGRTPLMVHVSRPPHAVPCPTRRTPPPPRTAGGHAG
jgi:hypothetical protein